MTTAPQHTDPSTLAGALREELLGQVIDPAHPGYDAARRVWNGLIDRRPAVIARCRAAADVVAAVRVARRFRPPVSIRGGGHQVAGAAVGDDALVIDLSGMTAVQVDPGSRTVHVEAGATWADVDRATQRHGLAVPGGEVSDTGVAGLTLGGGLGLLQRAHGLACDNLRAVEIVTADGTIRRASRAQHPDLFWAACGGGRGLGVVTAFEFVAHPLGPEVAMALVMYPYDAARDVLRAWRALAPIMPETVSPEFVLWSVPPDPAIPAELHGRPVAIVTGLYAGPAGEAAPVLRPLAELGTPLLDATATRPYVAVQSALDAAFPAGGRYFMKSHFLDRISDDVVDAMLHWDATRPTPSSLLIVRTLGGAVGRVDRDASAFAHRGAQFNLSIEASWPDPAQDVAAIGWARGAWDAIAPHATGGVYVNFAGLDGEAGPAATSGDNAARLARVRAAWDPDGLFG